MSVENPTAFNRRLGAAVRARRTELGLTQEQVALGLGVTFQQVQKYERGVNRLSVETIVLIAEILSTTPQALIEASGQTISESSEPAGLTDRMKIEAAKLMSALTPQRQLTARKMLKALAEEAA